MSPFQHPILEQSFAVIDQEMGSHSFSKAEYAIVRRMIHSTADFEFQHLVRFSPTAIVQGIESLCSGAPIITDVTMVRQGIAHLVQQTFGNPLISAIDRADPTPSPGKTRTETGILHCLQEFPSGIYVIGNAPTALLSLCTAIQAQQAQPKLVIGAPVGFISVVESKQVLAQTPVAQIRVEGRKGGSAVAAAIVNALLMLAWETAHPSL